MKVLQINVTLNTGSTGRIVEGISDKLLEEGDESYVIYGRNFAKTNSVSFNFTSKIEQYQHVLLTRFFDSHGLGSKSSTEKIVNQIKEINPDLIHLHNIHGYYLNYKILFKYLSTINIPVVWTLHDCWSYTGHCCYYERIRCKKWKTECSDCKLKNLYPKTLFFDNSTRNFKLKKSLFTGLKTLQLITVSNWLKYQVSQSFLKEIDTKTIYNGIDLEKFRILDPVLLKKKYNLAKKKVILGVANVWSEGKGLKVFKDLSKILKDEEIIVLIGLSMKQMNNLPNNIIGLSRTNSIDELVDYYNLADVFVNPSIAETFGMVTAESLACGTPIVGYNRSGTSELVSKDVGFLVDEGNINLLIEKIRIIINIGKEKYSNSCRCRAVKLFEINQQYNKYIQLYNSLIGN